MTYHTALLGRTIATSGADCGDCLRQFVLLVGATYRNRAPNLQRNVIRYVGQHIRDIP